jgi:hypothetical protein
MADNRPENMAELLSAIEAEWKRLLHVVGELTPEQMSTPDQGGWSPKDNLAHVAEWMRILMGYHMDKHPAHEVLGVAPEVTQDWEMEVINPVLFERNRARSTEDVLSDLKRTYAQLMTKLRTTPFETLMQPRHPDDPDKQPLVDWVVGNTSAHFAEHRETIEKAL